MSHRQLPLLLWAAFWAFNSQSAMAADCNGNGISAVHGDWLVKGPHVHVNGVEVALTRDLDWIPWPPRRQVTKKVSDALQTARP
jgi:hypothetical protein